VLLSRYLGRLPKGQGLIQRKMMNNVSGMTPDQDKPLNDDDAPILIAELSMV
jgi:hypothetical protein